MIFDEWLNQTEQNKSRLEIIHKELVLHRYIDNHSFWSIVLRWLKLVYDIGYNHAEQNSCRTIEALNNEINTYKQQICQLQTENLYSTKNKISITN